MLGNGLHGIQLVLSCKCTTETAKNSCSYVILLYIVASQPSQLRHSKNHREIWFILCWCQTTNNISWFYLNNEANVASPTLLKTEIHKSIILWFWYIFDQIPPAVSGLIRVLVGPLMQRLTVPCRSSGGGGVRLFWEIFKDGRVLQDMSGIRRETCCHEYFMTLGCCD